MKIRNVFWQMFELSKVLLKQIPLTSIIRSKSYSQFWEDRLMSRLISDHVGSYVDIGAGTPVWGSNTYFFYRRKWCGVTIDPIKFNVLLHKIMRPRDFQYQSLVSKNIFEVDFYELQPWELSTTEEKLARQRIRAGARLISKWSSKTISLREIYLKNPIIRPGILSIDVEGAEMDVLESNDWRSNKPDLICIEELQNPITHSAIRKYLYERNYNLVAYNGVSSIYVLNGSAFIK